MKEDYSPLPRPFGLCKHRVKSPRRFEPLRFAPPPVAGQTYFQFELDPEDEGAEDEQKLLIRLNGWLHGA